MQCSGVKTSLNLLAPHAFLQAPPSIFMCVGEPGNKAVHCESMSSPRECVGELITVSAPLGSYNND